MEGEEIIYRSPYEDVLIPNDKTLTEVVTKDIDARGDRIALIEAETGRNYTYSEVKSNIQKAKQTKFVNFNENFRSVLVYMAKGVGCGDVVCVYSANTLEYPILFHAIISLGITRS